MRGHQQPMLLAGKPHQRKPHQRRAGKIKPRSALLSRNRGQPLLARALLHARKIDAAPRRRARRHHNRHRPLQLLVQETGAQIGMPGQQGIGRSPQRLRIEPTLQRKRKLHRVQVRPLRLIKRVEQQPLL